MLFFVSSFSTFLGAIFRWFVFVWSSLSSSSAVVSGGWLIKGTCRIRTAPLGVPDLSFQAWRGEGAQTFQTPSPSCLSQGENLLLSELSYLVLMCELFVLWWLEKRGRDAALNHNNKSSNMVYTIP